MITRRNALAGTALGAVVTTSGARAASFGNPDDPGQGAVNATNPASLIDPGPQSHAIASQFPAAQFPPPTDVGDLPMFWASFNNAPKRVQNGGWARQVTQHDFQISDTIAGVNMRLTAGGVRELHWHRAAEWGYMTYGNCRITMIDEQGRPYIADVGDGDIWYFPAGLPHSLQGIGTDGCEFILCFDEGHSTEYNTLLLTDWLAHTPPEALAKNFGLPEQSLSTIPMHDLWIFQGAPPTDLQADRASVRAAEDAPPHPFTFSMASLQPARQTRGGEIRIADSTNFTVAKTIGAALVTVHPGGMREMHWHPNADEWQYWIKGRGRMTVFDTGPKAVTMDFNPGDIGYVKRSHGHYIENTGDADLVFLEVFRAAQVQEISLSQWLARTPPSLVAQHLNMDAATIARFPNDRPDVMPE